MEGALPEAVEGWVATATPDGAGNTVLEWTGGLLPADQDGAFPVTFMAPDTPGELLTFPAIQVCESGEELAWISGDPQDEFPAPRVLVLPVGFVPAATIDDVPLDAPGRQQLVEIVDVDNPSAPTTTAAPPSTSPTTLPPTTIAATTTEATTATTATTSVESTVPATSTATTNAEDDDTSGSRAIPVIVVGGLVALGAGAFGLSRRRRPGL
jgi:MYXO-CTERM domain-containing protein